MGLDGGPVGVHRVGDVGLQHPHRPHAPGRHGRVAGAPARSPGEHQQRTEQTRQRVDRRPPGDRPGEPGVGEDEQPGDPVDADPGGRRQRPGHLDPGVAGEVPREAAEQVGPQPLQRHPQGRQPGQRQRSGQRPAPPPQARPQGREGAVEQRQVGRQQAQTDQRQPARHLAEGAQRRGDPRDRDQPGDEPVEEPEQEEAAAAQRRAEQQGERRQRRPRRQRPRRAPEAQAPGGAAGEGDQHPAGAGRGARPQAGGLTA